MCSGMRWLRRGFGDSFYLYLGLGSAFRVLRLSEVLSCLRDTIMIVSQGCIMLYYSFCVVDTYTFNYMHQVLPAALMKPLAYLFSN